MSSRRGFFAIGIQGGKNAINMGTLWRSANILGAAYIFTVGRRYKRQSSDTLKSWRHMPLFHLSDLEDMHTHLPHDCRLVGIELDPDAVPLEGYQHWDRAVYLLGAEDHGLSSAARLLCHDLIVLPGERSMNVSVAGSIVMYDRLAKGCIPARIEVSA